MLIVSLPLFVLFIATAQPAGATSQWSRKTGMTCNACHSVFPRLNSYGDEYLRNGYQLASPREQTRQEGEIFLENVENLLGFRINYTPIQLETHSFLEDSGQAKSTRLTLGSPVWIQFFVAGSIFDDISFFSELEYTKSAFKFNWFYFNFTNIAQSSALNFQVGNISPVEFASYPDRLPQLPNIKGEVFHVRPSSGKGENSTKIRDAHPGIQYFGRHEWALWYAGISPGVAATQVSQFNEYWGGLVLKMPDTGVPELEGSTVTIHVHTGTDTKYTGQEPSGPQMPQVENGWTRIVPSINLRYDEKLDIQAAYLIAHDDNWGLTATNPMELSFSGVAVEAGYMPTPLWHLGLHYDFYESDETDATTGDPILQFQRIVPAITYVLNQNFRFTVYYEKDLTDIIPSDQKVDRILLNCRVMI
jgi:hypothetical protein